MRSGADALRLAPFENAVSAYRAILFAASALLLSAAMDVFVFFDFAWARGAHMPLLITIANLAVLAVLSIAVAAASRGRRSVETIETVPGLEVVEDKETIAAVQVLMEAKRVYRDVDLNLDRLARKTGISGLFCRLAGHAAGMNTITEYDRKLAAALTSLSLGPVPDTVETRTKSLRRLILPIGLSALAAIAIVTVVFYQPEMYRRIEDRVLTTTGLTGDRGRGRRFRACWTGEPPEGQAGSSAISSPPASLGHQRDHRLGLRGSTPDHNRLLQI